MNCVAGSSRIAEDGPVGAGGRNSMGFGRAAAPVLVPSGPPGVGKTSVGWRVFDLCTAAGDDPAFVDMDMMGAAWPAPDDDPHQSLLRARNLGAVWANYQAAGSRRLILADVVEAEVDRQRLSTAIAAPVVVCALVASPEALVSRISGRGRDHGPGLEKLIRRATTLAERLEGGDGDGLVVRTDDRSVDDIAAEVLRGWNLS